MTHRVSFTQAAQNDIAETLAWSFERFGEQVQQGYEELITPAIGAIAEDPQLGGSRSRPDLASNIRVLHLRTCRNDVRSDVRRIASPRHFVVYRQVGRTIQVVRLLHEAMNISSQHISE